MRPSYGLIAVGCVLLSGLVGCNLGEGDTTATSAASQSIGSGIGTVAVIDLNTVARRLGFDKQLTAAVQQRETSLNQQLATVKTSYEKQIAEQQRRFGAAPAPQQAQVLADMQKQAGVGLNQARQKAKQDLASHSTQLAEQFRDQVRPIAREIAREKGLSVIVTKNDSVLFDYDAAVDITDAVVQRIQTQPPSLAPGTSDHTAQRPAASPF